jgi:cation:H+ antiporter
MLTWVNAERDGKVFLDRRACAPRLQIMIFTMTMLVACALAIAVAGWSVVAAADAIGEKAGLGRAFLGMILIATITSLPELSTGISAVTIARSPDIAVGDVVGSCVFNLMLFAVADVASPGVAFYGRLNSSHNLTAAFGVILLGLLALSIVAPETARFSIGHVGLYSVLLALLYFAAARLLYAVNLRATPTDQQPKSHASMSLRSAIIRCFIAGAVVTIAGILLAVSASRLAEEANLTASFVGVLFVAAATSLPELVTTLVAVRMRAFDLAAGNLLGSNLFNMVILVVDDVAYVDGPLLASASDSLAVSAVVAMVMTAVIMAALNYVKRSKPHPVDIWAGVSLGLLYLFNAWLLFSTGTVRG